LRDVSLVREIADLVVMNTFKMDVAIRRKLQAAVPTRQAALRPR
jgi:hypothetical protein